MKTREMVLAELIACPLWRNSKGKEIRRAEQKRAFEYATVLGCDLYYVDLSQPTRLQTVFFVALTSELTANEWAIPQAVRRQQRRAVSKGVSALEAAVKLIDNMHCNYDPLSHRAEVGFGGLRVWFPKGFFGLELMERRARAA